MTDDKQCNDMSDSLFFQKETELIQESLKRTMTAEADSTSSRDRDRYRSSTGRRKEVTKMIDIYVMFYFFLLLLHKKARPRKVHFLI